MTQELACALHTLEDGSYVASVVFLVVMHEGKRRGIPACEAHRLKRTLHLPLGGPDHDETLHVFEVVERPTIEEGCC